ncbi:MAG: hypothetical protein ACHQIH_01705 [Ignavibacteria bacterium]
MENEINEVYSIISRNFEVEKSGELTIDTLVKMLSVRIRELLEKNLEKLVSIMYRIDLNQAKVDKIFENISKDEIAYQLAVLIIERQIEKIRTRRLYKSAGGEIEE